MMQRLEVLKGETLRNTLSVHFLSIVLSNAPPRSPRHVHYVCPAYLVLALLIKRILLVMRMFLVHISLLPRIISAYA